MRTLFTITLLFYALTISGQESAESSFRKYPVESTGCNVYLPVAPDAWTLEQSEDGSDVFTTSQTLENLDFDVIAVQFGEPFEGLSHDELESILISYLDFLKKAFEITESAGYGKGQQLPGNENAIGVLDYWKVAEGSQCKVKGWVTDTHLAVMMVTGVGNPSDESITDLFLNGFRFPEK